MPPIPEDAVVIADYMLMADFVPQTASGQQYISKGVRSVSISRDHGYFGTDAISLFETVDDTVHFSISAIGGNMVSGNGKLCDFKVTGLSTGTSTFTIVPEEIYFIDATAVIITDLEVGDLTITVSQ